MYGEPYEKVVALVLVIVFPEKVTMPYCRPLFSLFTVIGTPAESLGANVPSPG